jgi:hypothetical protein
VGEDRLEQRPEVRSRLGERVGGLALPGDRVEHREVDLRFVGAEVDVQRVDLVQHRGPASCRSILLITSTVRSPSLAWSTKRVWGEDLGGAD